MDFNLDKFLKRYVWDDEKTPYFTPSSRLYRTQAHYEALAYSVFIGILFTAVALTAMTGAAGQERETGPVIFGFTMICAAVIFGFTKNYFAALWLSSAPIAAIAYFVLYGFKPKWATIDQIVILGFVAVWILYSIRIVSIGRRYEEMPEAPSRKP